ncbi:coiled-coil domain-containing protein 102B [Phascolarctos cinereus]|uniref:Coiled-coil domain-containing protein 102B isoform X2 n=1 Tax=Phascolarctos cinereus TaxID=38626 RepID=A0A6P5K755_PHACI|nr:coiled-coil domain-containing protein 102B isoform X2 [Phascolarctos cinereus]
MNFDSIHKLIEETQIFKLQQSSLRSPCEPVTPASPLYDSCNSYLPPEGLYSRGAQNFYAHSYSSNDWDICEELRVRELEEVKARAAQMEKTMRWWSDCTANWREKWSKVRIERNKAREEGRQLRIKLEMAMKELSALKKKQSSLNEKETLDAEVIWKEKPGFVEGSCPQEAQFPVASKEYGPPRINLGKTQVSIKEDISKKEIEVVANPVRFNQDLNLQGLDFFRKGLSGNCVTKPALRLDNVAQPLEKELTQISTLKFHLDESQKILWKEREMRSSLEKEVELLESALSLWKCKYEEMKESKKMSLNQFNIFHDLHENEVEKVSEGRKDEGNCETSKDRLICELRAELERLQAESASEWGKREILETEKQGLERDNRRLKAQVKEMEELLDKKNPLAVTSQGPDLKMSQSELLEKNKELAELQHAYCKLNKQYQDKMAELIHANNRVDHHEAEVKKLRFRVEDLKKGLSHAEDELDGSLNQIRKLQRSLDEQIEMNDNLQIQLNHLQNRFKRPKNVSPAYGIKLSAKYTSEDSTEAEYEEEGDQCIS